MQKNQLSKIIVVWIIVLFIGIGIHPAFASDTKQTIIEQHCEGESNTDLIKSYLYGRTLDSTRWWTTSSSYVRKKDCWNY